MKNILRLAVIVCGLFLAPTLAQAANCWWVGTTGNWSTTADWASTTGGTAGTCGATGGYPHSASDNATLDGNSGTGTATLDGNYTIGNLTISAYAGTLALGSTNTTITVQFSDSGSAAGTLNCGTGTLTFTNTSGAVLTLTGTGYTSSCSGVTLVLQPTSITGGINFSLKNGATYGALTLINPSSSSQAFAFNIQGSSTNTWTIGTVTLTNVFTLVIQQSTTLTIANALNWQGTSVTPLFVSSNNIGVGNNQATITDSADTPTQTSTLNNLILYGIKFTNAVTAKNSYNEGNNSGLTVTAPVAGARCIGC